MIDAGSLFAAYTGDPKVKERTSSLIEDLMKTRDVDGYFHIKAQPEGRQNYLNWTLHEQEYAVLGLVHNGRACGSPPMPSPKAACSACQGGSGI